MMMERGSFMIYVFFIMLLFILLIFQYINQQKQLRLIRQELERAIEVNDKKTLSIIDYVQHKRHDWMNTLQIVYGYVQLKKIDKIIPHVERIKEELRQESTISQLGFPQMEWFLLCFLAEQHSFEVELEIAEDMDLTNLPIDQDRFKDVFVGIAHAFQSSSAQYMSEEENFLTIVIDTYQNSACFSFLYEGEINTEILKAKVYDIEMLQVAGLQQTEMEIQKEFEDRKGFIQCFFHFK